MFSDGQKEDIKTYVILLLGMVYIMYKLCTSVNSKNYRYWCCEHHPAVYEAYDLETGVLVSSECMQDHMVCGFCEAVNSVFIFDTSLYGIKKKRETTDYSYFMQDSGMAYTLNF